MDKNYLSTVVLDELAAFLADGVWHNDNGLIAADCSDESETYALIAACGFNDDRVLVYFALTLSVEDHIISSSCFY